MITNKKEAYQEAEKIDILITEQVKPLMDGNRFDWFNGFLYLRTLQTTLDILKITL